MAAIDASGAANSNADDKGCELELDFKVCHRQGLQHWCFLGCHNLEVFALTYRDQDGLYAWVPEAWRWYKLRRALGDAYSLVCSYIAESYRQGCELQLFMISRIAEAEYSILSLWAFLRAAHVGVKAGLSFNRMATSCKFCGELLRIPMPLVLKWFSFGTLRLLDRLNVDLLLSLVPMVRVCDVSLSALSNQSLFPYEY